MQGDASNQQCKDKKRFCGGKLKGRKDSAWALGKSDLEKGKWEHGQESTTELLK
jgi:hypothetical protein